jgi:hypothetical protein
MQCQHYLTALPKILRLALPDQPPPRISTPAEADREAQLTLV